MPKPSLKYLNFSVQLDVWPFKEETVEILGLISLLIKGLEDGEESADKLSS